MAFTIKFDYRFDINGFFADAGRRATLEAAAAEWEMLIRDDFASIPVGASFDIRDPSDPSVTHVITLTEAIDDIVVFVGARAFPGSTAAVAGPSGFDIEGDIYSNRITNDFRGNGAVTDFEPWTGTISFDTTANWHDNMAEPASDKLDLFTVAVHELAHILGVGTAGAFDALITGSSTSPGFAGVNSMALNGGNPVPLDPDEGHVADGFAGDIVVLDPTLSSGMRMRPSEYDKALLADIGYDIEGYIKQGTTPPIATNAGETIFGSAFADSIDGLGGNDQIQAAEGNDFANGGSGSDTLFGGSGNDTLRGGEGADNISGNDDNDVIFGDGGGDIIFGGNGADTIYGGAGNDQLQAGSGSDVISGGAGNDSIFGQGGVDVFEFGLGGGVDQLYDFDLNNEIVRLVDSGFETVSDALAAISLPFQNVSRITLSDGSYLDVFHDSVSSSPLTAAHIEIASSATVPPNASPTGAISITGSLLEGAVLTADMSGVLDADGLGTFSYIWFRDGAETGETSASYTLNAVDSGAQISVSVSYVDGRGTAESLTSQQTTPIENVNDTPTGSVQVTGAAVEGGTLIADSSTIADADGLGDFSYTWLRDAADTGVQGTVYTLTAADVGAQMSVRVNYTDALGTAETLTSASSVSVLNVNDVPSGAVVILGVSAEGNILTADTSGVSDADGLGNLSYVWLRDGLATASTGATYDLTSADIGAQLSVRVSYIDGQGTTEVLTSTPTLAVENVNSAPIGVVLTQGTPAVGRVLSVDTRLLIDDDGLGEFSYAWLRNGIDIGVSTSTYTISAADVGASISVQVSYIDAQNTAESLLSVATSPVQNVNNAPTGTVTVIGTPTEGNTLVANAVSLDDVDGVGPFVFNWLRDGQEFGASAQFYTLSADDIGAQMSVSVSYTDGLNALEIVTSAATSTVLNTNDPAEGTVTISGSTTTGDVLTADASDIVDRDGVGVVSFVWLRDGENIGETGPIYLLTAADVDARITVEARYQDDQGTNESVLSAPTDQIAAAPVNLTGDAGDNVIVGTDADETLTGGAGTDILTGADGRDTFVISPGDHQVTIADFQQGIDTIDLSGFDRSNFLTLLSNVTDGTISVVLSDGTKLALEGSGLSFDDLTLSDFILASGNTPATGKPTISGSLRQGETLAAETDDIGDIDGIPASSFTYQWLRDGETILGATGATFDLGQSEVGAVISVIIQFTDEAGTAEARLSDISVSVENINDAATGTLRLPEVLKVGSIAEGNASDIADIDGLTIENAQYQWFRDGQPIAGATQPTYPVTSSDTGMILTLRMEITDDLGGAETLVSSAIYVPVEGKVLVGSTFDDRIVATAGDDTIDGNIGADTVFFEGNQASYTAVLSADGLLITDRRSETDGGQGVDFLKDIEFLDFGIEIPLYDGPMNLDVLDDPVNLSSENFASITELYIAYFNRAPDAIGLYYWASEIERGYTLREMANSLFVQDETRETYRDVLTDDEKSIEDLEAFVTAVYQNVLGRNPDAPGFAYWIDELENNPDITAPMFILAIINGAKFPSDPTALTAIDQDYLAGKSDVGIYYSVIKGLSNVEDASTVMAAFDGTEAGTSAAVELTNSFYQEAIDPLNGDFLFQLSGVLDDPFAIA